MTETSNLPTLGTAETAAAGSKDAYADARKVAPLDLPDPDDHPDRDVVIWDGKCIFCRQQVERLTWFDAGGKLAYFSLHDPRVTERYPNLSQSELMGQMWVITPSGERHGGADAGHYLSRKLPRLWWLAPLLHIPFSMPLWRSIYAAIAKRRYKISGIRCDDEGTCNLH